MIDTSEKTEAELAFQKDLAEMTTGGMVGGYEVPLGAVPAGRKRRKKRAKKTK